MIQLPFAIILLIFGPTSGIIISKVGSKIPIIAGTCISTLGFFLLYLFHSTELLVSIDLAVLAIGISLTNVGAVNVVILSTPRQNSGISMGMTMLMRIIGSAIGPVVAAIFMDLYLYRSTSGAAATSGSTNSATVYYPSAQAFDLVFLTCTLVALFSVILAIMSVRKVPRCQNHLLVERGEAQGDIVEAIKKEVLSWPGVTARAHDFGGTEFRVRSKEIGHIHGNNMVDLPLTPDEAKALAIRRDSGEKPIGPTDKLIETKGKEGSLPSNDTYPECKWINYWIKNDDDRDQVISLFRLQYSKLTKGRN
jgi:hypothetical protein